MLQPSQPRRALLALTLMAVAMTLGGGTVGGAAGSPTRCVVPGATESIDQIWQPDMASAIGYAQSRTGDIAFAVRTDHRFYGYRPDYAEWSASVVKAMLMAAYLDQPSVANRNLDGYDKSLLDPMITQSDNNAAQQVFNTVGQGGLQAVANQVGMTNFATDPVWGKTRITASDQTKFFLHYPDYIPPLHQGYAMYLLAHIVPWERWGIGEVAPYGWALFFKGGWGYGTGLLDHQVALLVRGCARVSIAVLSMYDGSHDYGKETLRGIFERLLHGFPIQPAEEGGQQAERGAPEDERQRSKTPTEIEGQQAVAAARR